MSNSKELNEWKTDREKDIKRLLAIFHDSGFSCITEHDLDTKESRTKSTGLLNGYAHEAAMRKCQLIDLTETFIFENREEN